MKRPSRGSWWSAGSWPWTICAKPRRAPRGEEKLDKVRLPVDQGRLEVLRRALELAERDYAMRRQELQTKQGIKQGEVEAIRIELANLELERQQAIIRAPIDGMVTTGT